MLLDHDLSVIRFAITLHNEVDDADEPVEALLVGNTLIFQVTRDRDIRPEESDQLYVYRVSDEEKDKLKSWPADERDISCEWIYVNHEDPNTPHLLPQDYAGLDEEDAERYTLELDVNI